MEQLKLFDLPYSILRNKETLNALKEINDFLANVLKVQAAVQSQWEEPVVDQIGQELRKFVASLRLHGLYYWIQRPDFSYVSLPRKIKNKIEQLKLNRLELILNKYFNAKSTHKKTSILDWDPVSVRLRGICERLYPNIIPGNGPGDDSSARDANENSYDYSFHEETRGELITNLNKELTSLLAEQEKIKEELSGRASFIDEPEIGGTSLIEKEAGGLSIEKNKGELTVADDDDKK